MEDRVSISNIVAKGGTIQVIKSRVWTPLVDKDGIYKITMPDGSTKVNVWVSFNQPSANKPKNFQFRIMRAGGDFTARTSILLTSLTDVGLTYGWELSTGPTNPNTIWVEVWHDAPNSQNIEIGEFEAHYKHIPEVVIK